MLEIMPAQFIPTLPSNLPSFLATAQLPGELDSSEGRELQRNWSVMCFSSVWTWKFPRIPSQLLKFLWTQCRLFSLERIISTALKWSIETANALQCNRENREHLKYAKCYFCPITRPGEIHSLNRRVFIVVCAARIVSALDFPGNWLNLS